MLSCLTFGVIGDKLSVSQPCASREVFLQTSMRGCLPNALVIYLVKDMGRKESGMIISGQLPLVLRRKTIRCCSSLGFNGLLVVMIMGFSENLMKVAQTAMYVSQTWEENCLYIFILCRPC